MTREFEGRSEQEAIAKAVEELQIERRILILKFYLLKEKVYSKR